MDAISSIVTFLELNPDLCRAVFRTSLELVCEAREDADGTCERGAFSQDLWAGYRPRQTGSSPASPRFDLRFGKSLHAPPSEGKQECHTSGANVNREHGGWMRGLRT